MKKSKRSHDKFYLKEKVRNKPKESFKFILKHIDGSLNEKKILDVGCANGDFLFFLKKKFPTCHLYGSDIDKELIFYAKKQVPSIKKIFKFDITKKNLIDEKFDVIFMNGVHSIFDTCEEWVENLINLMKNHKSKIYVFGIWNPYDLDVILRAKKTFEFEWEQGWNLHSKKTISKLIKKANYQHRFHDFNININIKRRSKDLLRSWTMKLKNNQNLITNGTGIIHYYSLLKIFK